MGDNFQVDSAGNVGIRTAPNPTVRNRATRLAVESQIFGNAIYAHSSGIAILGDGGVGILGTTVLNSGYGVIGEATGVAGYGLYGLNGFSSSYPLGLFDNGIGMRFRVVHSNSASTYCSSYNSAWKNVFLGDTGPYGPPRHSADGKYHLLCADAF